MQMLAQTGTDTHKHKHTHTHTYKHTQEIVIRIRCKVLPRLGSISVFCYIRICTTASKSKV